MNRWTVLDADDIAYYLNVPESWVKQQARALRFTHYRPGGGKFIRFLLEDFQEDFPQIFPADMAPIDLRLGRLLTVPEVAELLEQPEKTVYQWIRCTRGGEFTAKNSAPHFRLGRYVRFRREDVLAWFDNRGKRVKQKTIAALSDSERLYPAFPSLILKNAQSRSEGKKSGQFPCDIPVHEAIQTSPTENSPKPTASAQGA